MGHLLFELEIMARMVLGGVCGAAIGLERSRRFKEAGIRTHILVAIGATLMIIVSKYAFSDLAGDTAAAFGTRGADPARIAAQIVSGIGFLGAGVIFKYGGVIKGLTTAAGLWATAGVGMAIGSGLYIEGIVATLLILLTQFIMHKINIGRDNIETLSIKIIVHDSVSFKSTFGSFSEQRGASVKYTGIDKNHDGTITLFAEITVCKKQSIDELVEFAELDSNVVEFRKIQIV